MDHGILKTGVPGGEPYPFKQGPAIQLAPGSAGQLHHIQPPGAGVARFCVLLHRTAGVGFVAILPAALHDIRPGTRLRRQQRLHCVRQQAVIAIHKQDPAAHRPGQTGVAGAGRAAALLRVQHGDPSLPGVLGQNGPAAVGGAVLHRQHLQAASGVLVQDAVQTGAQKALPVVHRHDHRHIHRIVLRRQRAGLPGIAHRLRADARRAGGKDLQLLVGKALMLHGSQHPGGTAARRAGTPRHGKCQRLTAGFGTDELADPLILQHDCRLLIFFTPSRVRSPAAAYWHPAAS